MAEQTHPDLARLRRKYGGAWKITFVVEGFDEEFEVHTGIQLSKHFAEQVGRQQIVKLLKIPRRYIHLVMIEED